MNNNYQDKEEIFVIAECPICGKKTPLTSEKEINDRSKFKFWCDDCLASIFNEVNVEFYPIFKSIN